MAANRVTLKGKPILKEGDAGGAILPGYLIERNAVDTVQAHGTADGVAAKLFALRAPANNKGFDDAYIAGERVQYGAFRPGDEVWAWLEAGQNAAYNAVLVSNGNGKLKVNAAGAGATEAGAIVGLALEAVNATGGDKRIKVEVL